MYYLLGTQIETQECPVYIFLLLWHFVYFESSLLIRSQTVDCVVCDGERWVACTRQVFIPACAPELVGFTNKLPTTLSKLESATVFDFRVESGGIYAANGNRLDSYSAATFFSIWNTPFKAGYSICSKINDLLIIGWVTQFINYAFLIYF